MQSTSSPGLSQIDTDLQQLVRAVNRLTEQTSLGVVVPITQGGTGAVTATGARNNLGIGTGGTYLIGELLGADFNVMTDQAIPLTVLSGTMVWVVDQVIVSNPSMSLTAARGGIYIAPGKSGFQIVAAAQVYSGLTTNTANTAGSALVVPTNQTALLTVTTAYLSLSNSQGMPATADVRIFARSII